VFTEERVYLLLTHKRGTQLDLVIAKAACIAYTLCMQYTIRNVPEFLDAALRVKAREQGKSLNEVAVEALARGFGLGDERVRQRDVGDIAGSWKKDPAFDRAIAAQDTVDEEMWL
jgi:plasmid stability protein